MQTLLEDALQSARPYVSSGQVAEYIPALSKANPSHLGVAVAALDGNVFTAGQADVPFTIQSISKVFSLVLAMKSSGAVEVFRKVGMEPSGNPFYSLVQLEYESGKPRNPFVNAGAIAVCGLLPGSSSTEKTAEVLKLLSALSGRSIMVNEEVYESENTTGNRNRAVGYFMKHFGVIEGDVNVAVECYFRICSIEMTCVDLARCGLFLANRGVDAVSSKTILVDSDIRWINALMTTCGLYDASGEFACRVGVPGKSGVGGGILAAVPGKMSVAAFGPALDQKGNSLGAFHILENLSEKLSLSVFA